MNSFKKYFGHTTKRELKNISLKKYVDYYLPLFFVTLIFLMVLVSNPTFLYAATDINSNISIDTPWIKSESPYVITGDIVVNGSASIVVTLTIEPGVEVQFKPGASLQIGNGLNKGALIAKGTLTEPIIFTTISTEPRPGQWKGIYFASQYIDETSIMEHCVVAFAGSSGHGAIHLTAGASPTIKNSLIGANSHYGICCNSGSPTILNSDIYSNNSCGIYCGNDSAPVITN